MTNGKGKTSEQVFYAIVSVIVIIIAIVSSIFIVFGCDEGDGETEQGESATEMPEIRDVFVLSSISEYDGEAHGVLVIGAKATDRVEYSSDGREWGGEEIMYTDAGEYNVYCRVERAGYKEYTCTAEIVINKKKITGIEAEDIAVYEGEKIEAKITGTEANDEISYRVNDGEYGNGIEQGLKSGTYEICYLVTRKNHEEYEGKFMLTVKEKEEIEITVNGKTYTVMNNGEQTVNIYEDKERMVITVGGKTIVETEGNNYCESITGVKDIRRDYKENSVTATTTGEDITVTLSERKIQTTERIEKDYIYDGEAHGIDEQTTEPVRYVAVGEYESEVVLLKDGYLPKIATCVIRIMPDMTGVYVNASGVVEIDGEKAKINGKEAKYEYGMKAGEIDGKTVTYGEGKITYDGLEYALTEEQYIAITVNGVTATMGIEEGDYELVITETKIELMCDGEPCFERATDGRAVTVQLDGEELLPDDVDGVSHYYITIGDLHGKQIAWLSVATDRF